MYKSILRRSRILFIILCTGFAACASKEQQSPPPLKVGQKIPGDVKYYRLVQERGIDYDRPLAQYIPLYVELRDDSQILGRYLKYMAWDFDRDGSADMLEELDPNFNIISRTYDFSLPELGRDNRLLTSDESNP